MVHIPERETKFISCPHIATHDDEGRTPDTGILSKNIMLLEDESQVVRLLLCPMCHGLVRDAIYQETIQDVIQKQIKPLMGLRW